MSFEYLHRTAHLVDPRGQKSRALVVALILSIGAFLLAAGEAQAEQRSVVVQQHMPMVGSGHSTQVSGSHFVSTPAVEASFSQAPPPGSSMLTLQPELVPSPDPGLLRAETLRNVSLMNESATLVEQPGLKPVIGKPTPPIAWEAGTNPEHKNLLALGDQQVPMLERHVDSKPATKPALNQTAAFIQENDSLLPLTERKFSAPPKKTFSGSTVWAQQPPQTPPATPQTPARGHTVVATVGGEGDPVVGETPPVQMPAEMPLVDRAPLVAPPPTATAAPVERALPIVNPYPEKSVVPQPAAPATALTPPSIDLVVAAPSSAIQRAPVPVGNVVQPPQNAAGAAANMVPAFTGGPSSTGSPSRTEDTSKGTPTPSAPSVPLDSGSLALSGGGQAGSSDGGGVAPLFLLVLAAILLVSGWEDGVLSLISCRVPKPSSALLMPLERPG